LRAGRSIVPPDRSPSSYMSASATSGMTLAYDVGVASLPLGVERIEFLIEALVGRFSGVDRAADGQPGLGVINPRHGPLSRLSKNPAAAA
jgi:hypothetical protein